jgi:hypothetical protein
MMKTLKCIVFSICVFILPQCTEAQNLATTIKIQGMDMGTSFMKNDFNRFVKYMHPNIIAFAGGKENMKIKMDSAYLMMKEFGVTFKKYWIGNPGKIIKYKNQLQTVLPQSTTLKTPLGELTAETYWIVISDDKGKNWWFIDTNAYRADKLKNIIPDLSPQLVIPPRKKPKLVPVEND